MRTPTILILLAVACASFVAGCESDGKPVPPTPQTTEPDGRNLGPALQPYGGDPLFPYQEHQGGGGGGRR